MVLGERVPAAHALDAYERDSQQRFHPAVDHARGSSISCSLLTNQWKTPRSLRARSGTRRGRATCPPRRRSCGPPTVSWTCLPGSRKRVGSDAPSVQVAIATNPEWLSLQARVIAALVPFREAREAVLAALRGESVSVPPPCRPCIPLSSTRCTRFFLEGLPEGVFALEAGSVRPPMGGGIGVSLSLKDLRRHRQD
jgi:hypothetical protein